MLKTIALIAVGAALALAPVGAVAQTGYGVSPGKPSTTTFDRSWNRFNESKERARAGAAYVRGDHQSSPYRNRHHYHQ
jgi:hypothetical protein